jgi:hypothetical protein
MEKDESSEMMDLTNLLSTLTKTLTQIQHVYVLSDTYYEQDVTKEIHL